jgi:hypothetical protein
MIGVNLEALEEKIRTLLWMRILQLLLMSQTRSLMIGMMRLRARVRMRSLRQLQVDFDARDNHVSSVYAELERTTLRLRVNIFSLATA